MGTIPFGAVEKLTCHMLVPIVFALFCFVVYFIMAGTTIDRQTIDYSVSVTEYEAVWKNFCKEWDSCDVYKILECIVKDVIYIFWDLFQIQNRHCTVQLISQQKLCRLQSQYTVYVLYTLYTLYIIVFLSGLYLSCDTKDSAKHQAHGQIFTACYGFSEVAP